MGEDIEAYLKEVGFDNQFKNLTQKLRNKRILIYGTGSLYQLIKSKCDLSKLSIINLSDEKIISEQVDGSKPYLIPVDKIKSLLTFPKKIDCILVAIKDYEPVIESLKKKFHFKKIYPLVKNTSKKESLPEKDKNNRIKIYFEDGRVAVFKSSPYEHLKIKFNGENSLVTIHEPVKFLKNEIVLFDNSFVEIQKTPYSIRYFKIYITNNSKITIDENFCVAGAPDAYTRIISKLENSTIEIGKNCMLAKGVSIMNCDNHPTFDALTNEMLTVENKNKKIGNNVWIGQNVTILKNAFNIANGTIIGAQSVVTKSFNEENCAIAGNSAKIVRKNILWKR